MRPSDGSCGLASFTQDANQQRDEDVSRFAGQWVLENGADGDAISEFGAAMKNAWLWDLPRDSKNGTFERGLRAARSESGASLRQEQIEAFANAAK